jgi:uncharacterized membrane protein YphA (DoxX/SURF4 family)
MRVGYYFKVEIEMEIDFEISPGFQGAWGLIIDAVVAVVVAVVVGVLLLRGFKARVACSPATKAAANSIMVTSVEAIVIPVGIGDFIRHDFLLVNVVVEVVVEVEVAANSFLALVERPRRKRPR